MKTPSTEIAPITETVKSSFLYKLMLKHISEEAAFAICLAFLAGTSNNREDFILLEKFAEAVVQIENRIERFERATKLLNTPTEGKVQ